MTQTTMRLGADALMHLRDEAIALICATPDLAAFAPLPDHAVAVDKPPKTPPAVETFLRTPSAPIASTAAFTKAVTAAAPYAHWRQTYTEEQVGPAFLAHYAWMELWGPSGHFYCENARAYVAFWGPGLYYDWHQHEAEELYFVVSGSAEFMAKGAGKTRIHAGGTQQHSSNQLHAMTTMDDPILTLVLWRGPGLAGIPTMVGEVEDQ